MNKAALARIRPVRLIQTICCAAGLVLLALAGLAVFWPLATNVVGTCGPDGTSSSAVAVLRDPDIVNIGSPAHEPAETEHLLKDMCLGEARRQLAVAHAIGVTGLILAAGVPAVSEVLVRRARPRRASNAVTANSGAPRR